MSLINILVLVDNENTLTLEKVLIFRFTLFVWDIHLKFTRCFFLKCFLKFSDGSIYGGWFIVCVLGIYWKKMRRNQKNDSKTGTKRKV